MSEKSIFGSTFLRKKNIFFQNPSIFFRVRFFKKKKFREYFSHRKILADERSDFCCRFQIYLQKFIFLRKNVKKLDFFTHKGASRGMKKSRIFFRPLILGQKTFYYHERASRQWNFTEIFSPQSIPDTQYGQTRKKRILKRN